MKNEKYLKKLVKNSFKMRIFIKFAIINLDSEL